MPRLPSGRAPTLLRRALATTPPDGPQMSFRARGYLWVGAYRHLALGLAMVCLPRTFERQPAFRELFEFGSEHFWSLSMLAGGIHLAYAAYKGSIVHARVALGIAVVVGAVWATAFALVVLDGFASWFAFIYLSAFTAKDLLQCAQPMRTPFEDLAAVYGEKIPKLLDN